MMESWEREPRHSDYAVAEHLNTLKQMSGFWNYVVKEEVGLMSVSLTFRDCDSHAGSGAD